MKTDLINENGLEVVKIEESRKIPNIRHQKSRNITDDCDDENYNKNIQGFKIEQLDSRENNQGEHKNRKYIYMYMLYPQELEGRFSVVKNRNVCLHSY